jgi:SAM-dependent methyltransferase
MASEGAAPTLVDYSEPALEQARARFDRLGLTANFVRSDMFDIGNDLAGKFDVAMSLGVVEHFRGTDRTRAIRTHVGVLRPSGVCLISVPNAACLTYRAWKMSLEIRRWWPYGIEIPYRRRELTGRALRAGLVEVHVVGTGFWQSVGDHLLHGVLEQSRDWAACRSFCDNRLGVSLLLIGRRPPRTTETRLSP